MLSMVVQENNFREMADFVRLARQVHADSVQFHKLLNWGTSPSRNIWSGRFICRGIGIMTS